MRRKLDQYFTPASATLTLLREVPAIGGTILECCSGTNQIAQVLPGTVLTNDIDPGMPSVFHEDATQGEFWEHQRPDWVVSNLPFSCCQPIILHAFERARVGIAMLLRLSYAEPCNDRAEFLAEHAPALLILPRISFTGDGKTDNVTCAWFVWNKLTGESFVKVIPKRLMVQPTNPVGFQYAHTAKIIREVSPCSEDYESV